MKKVLENILFYLLWGFARMIAVSPYFVQYRVVHSFFYGLFRYVLRYRRKLIVKQLSDSFPEKSQKEIQSIANKYYGTLSTMIVNTFVMAGMKESEMRKRVSFPGLKEQADSYAGRDIVVLTSHFGFWEYYLFAELQLYRTHRLMVAFHALRSRIMSRFYERIRSISGVEPVSSEMYLRRYILSITNRKEGEPNVLLGLISDQNSAPHGKNPHWYKFLNHPTIFFEGGEKMALKYHLPVIYLNMIETKRGYYNSEMTVIYDGYEKVDDYVITQRYADCLERDIRLYPHLWMWSHNRWKYYPDPVTGEPCRIAKSKHRQKREAEDLMKRKLK